MITVTGCRILVKPFKLQEHDKVFAAAKRMGLEIPQTSQRMEETKVDRGTVIQIGDRVHEDYTSKLAVGDVIGFAKFGGKYIQDTDDEFYLVINDEDVICIFKE